MRTPGKSGTGGVTTAMFEIVDIGEGEIVLRRPGGEGTPLVRIRFSDESRAYLGEAQLAVARAMIEAGIQEAVRQSGSEAELDFVAAREGRERQLH